MKKQFYLTLSHKEESNTCDYALFSDYEKRNLIGAGSFDKERGGLFATAITETVHRHKLGKLLKVLPLTYDCNLYQLTVEVSQ